MNTAAFRSDRIPRRIAVCRWPVVGPLAVRGFNAFARAALTMAVERPLSDSVRRGLVAPYDSWAHRVAVQRFVEDIPLRPEHPSWETLVGIEEGLPGLADLPILLIWGMRDWCFSPWFLHEFQHRWPEAQSVEIADAGHYVFEDAREAVTTAIGDFLAQQTPG